MKKRIVVTGLGVVSSIGIGKDNFWDSLIKGKSGISTITSFDTSQHFSHYGGEVKDFNPEDFIDKKRVKLMGRTSHLAISATKLALEDAGLGEKDLSQYRVGVCIGTTMGEPQRLEEIDRVWIREGIEKVDKRLIFQYPTNTVSSNIAIEFEFRAHNRIFTTACSAGNYAIGYGYDLLRLGKADIVIAGGSDSFSYVAFTGFNQLLLIAPQICQPFDKNRKGIIVGEGAGALILEALENALERSANIYAEILGYGLSCDAHHMTTPHEDGIVECIMDALRQTNLTPEDIDYINAHGTGTPHNDRAECSAIKRVFGKRYKKIPISSIKSMLGHTMGASSAIEAIACCLTLKNNIIPPTINYQTPDPECDIDCVPNKARKQKVNIVLNNAFAFGGNNACLVLKKIERGD
jgi:3-oxoacyl-[acyl-carrier-protein] synthase II